MDLFPDGCFVRLQNRANDKYIHAEGDWLGVILRPLSRVPSLEAVWRVERWVTPNRARVFVLLQNAAYGRYLSFSAHPAWRGHAGGCLVIQRDYDEPDTEDAFLWRWTPQRVRAGQNHVHLRQLNYNLRASRWSNRVTADPVGSPTFPTVMQWTVHTVAATPLPLPLPVRRPEPQVQRIPWWISRRGGHLAHLWFWALWWGTGYGPGVYEDVPREIRHVRANDEGNFEQNRWLSFIEHDLPVVNLWQHLAILQNDWTGNMLDFTLCIQPGSHGRLMPLATHLPRSQDRLSIVVLRNGTLAAAALRYPQIYALRRRRVR